MQRPVPDPDHARRRGRPPRLRRLPPVQPPHGPRAGEPNWPPSTPPSSGAGQPRRHLRTAGDHRRRTGATARHVGRPELPAGTECGIVGVRRRDGVPTSQCRRQEMRTDAVAAVPGARGLPGGDADLLHHPGPAGDPRPRRGPPRARARTTTSRPSAILNAAGLAVPHWPVEWGGRDWTPLQRHIWREEMQLASRAGAARLQRQHDRPGDRGLRLPGAEGALPAADGEPRHLVVPGLLRARRRLRPRLAAHHRGARRRRLGRQRPEDLDHARPVRRLDLLPGPHRPDRREEAARHLAAALPDGLPRRHAAPDRADRRRLRGQRGVLRGRPRARREPRRRGEPGLGLRQVPARQRARRHRPRRRDQAAARPGQGARPGDHGRRRPARSTTRSSPRASPSSRTSCSPWS